MEGWLFSIKKFYILTVHLCAFVAFLEDPMKSEQLYSFKFMCPFKFHTLFLMRKLKGSNLRTQVREN